MTPPPHPRGAEIGLALLASLAWLWAVLPTISPDLLAPQWDEFIRLTNAARLYAGELPYRDYLDHTPPLPDVLYAALFVLVGGPNAGAARLVTHVVVAAGALALYAAARALGAPPSRAALPAACFGAVAYLVWPVPLHHWLGAATSAFALVAGAFALTRGRRDLALLAGALAALAGLCVQTHGALALAALVALPACATGEAPSSPRRLAGPAALGVAAVLAASVVLLLALGLLPGFVERAILFPLFDYRTEGGVNDVGVLADLGTRLDMVARSGAPSALRHLQAGFLLAAVVVPIASAVALASAVVAERRAPRRAAALAAPLLVAAAALAPRPDVLHFAIYGVVPTLLACLAAPAAPAVVRRGLVVVLAASLAVAVTAQLVVPRALGATAPPVLGEVDVDDPAFAGLPPVDAAMVAADARLALLRRFAHEHPHARLLAAPVGAPAYFLAMPAAVPLTLLYDPSTGFHGERDWARVVSALEARPADVVMLTSRESAAAFLAPPAHAPPSAHALARLLRDRYEPWHEVGATTFLRLRGAP